MKTLVLLGALLMAGCSTVHENSITFPSEMYRHYSDGVYGKAYVTYDIKSDGSLSNIRVDGELREYFKRRLRGDMLKWRFDKDHPKKDQKITINFVSRNDK